MPKSETTQPFLASVVVPVFNEQGNVQLISEALLEHLYPYTYEIIFINDGSTDNTEMEVKTLCQGNQNIKLISFRRNFGHQNALSAGYKAALGDCIISIDADLQDDPSVIPRMVEAWHNGSKIVYAKRKQRRNDSLFKKVTARLFYKFINSLSEVPIPSDVGDFRLLDRQVVNFLNELPEQTRFLRGLVAWGGFSSTVIEFDRGKRTVGKTHYSLFKMISFAFNGISSFSTKPLHIASYLGFVTASFGFIGIIYAVVGRLFFQSYWVTGWTALFVGIMFLGGVQLITMGIIGEYVGKIYLEIQKRPMYLVKETVNIDK